MSPEYGYKAMLAPLCSGLVAMDILNSPEFSGLIFSSVSLNVFITLLGTNAAEAPVTTLNTS